MVMAKNIIHNIIHTCMGLLLGTYRDETLTRFQGDLHIQ